MWDVFLAFFLLVGVAVVGLALLGACTAGTVGVVQGAVAERARAEASLTEARTARDREANVHRETVQAEANAHREALVAMVLGRHSAAENWLGVVVGASAAVVVGWLLTRFLGRLEAL